MLLEFDIISAQLILTQTTEVVNIHGRFEIFMVKEYRTTKHRKFLVQYHVILVCKYRKHLLVKLGNVVKSY